VRVSFDPPGDSEAGATEEDDEEREREAADERARGRSGQNIERLQ
jgi:hypothetical protein